MSPGSVFFVFCSLVALIGALAVILARNPIRSAVGLLASILGVAGLFLKLNAQFLAAVQLIVYAGAVVVLFVFVIMLLGPESGAAEPGGRSKIARGVGATLVVALAAATLVALTGAAGKMAEFAPARVGHGSVEAVGGLIFSRGLVAFELATALLVVAIVGAIALVRGKPRKQPPPATDDASRRMYQGPVHPRDTGEPVPKEPVP